MGKLSLKKPVLQVALDLLTIDETINIAKRAIDGGVDWIEAGTPLIKYEGVKAVKKLREVFPEAFIVADMKTMDTGSLECKIALENGANIMTVLGVAPNETIEAAVDMARELRGYVMVDLINVQNVFNRAKEAESLGADIICLHLGIDQQKKHKIDFETVHKLFEMVSIPIAVAGGINKDTAPLAIKSGAKIIIVGSAITKSKDPKASALEIKRAMESVYEIP
ncbi:MAG TPA: DUF561 domain-containing protein [Thermoprotei archaeon]|nr:DUF561 domain-containing protein [Thermoprotei archaeon]